MAVLASSVIAANLPRKHGLPLPDLHEAANRALAASQSSANRIIDCFATLSKP